MHFFNYVFCACVATSFVIAHPVGAQTSGVGNAIASSARGTGPAGSATVVRPAQGSVVVSGVVQDEAVRQAIVSKVRELYGRERTVDQLGVAAASTPPHWAENVNKLITPDLLNVHRGQLKISGNIVELTGEVESRAIREKIGANFSASLNPTYTVDNRLTVVEGVQARIDGVLDGKIVEFESGSAVLSPVGLQVLGALLPALKSLNGKRVEVIGHTDSVGLRGLNVALSLNRAAAVKAYLVENGIPAPSILIQGVGPDRPLVTNETPEGRAKNRRIEFRVVDEAGQN